MEEKLYHYGEVTCEICGDKTRVSVRYKGQVLCPACGLPLIMPEAFPEPEPVTYESLFDYTIPDYTNPHTI